MPTPERTSRDAIVAAGCDLLETAGLDGLTMQAVAERVGVRAPSLYKRVRNRHQLVTLVAEASLRELSTRMDAAAGAPGRDPGIALRRVARACRAFAHERPEGFRLIFASTSGVALGVEALSTASAPVLRVAAELAGQERALDAARTFTAWANGFISMELAGAFRLGGDVDAAFEYGLVRLTRALSSPDDDERLAAAG